MRNNNTNKPFTLNKANRIYIIFTTVIFTKQWHRQNNDIEKTCNTLSSMSPIEMPITMQNANINEKICSLFKAHHTKLKKKNRNTLDKAKNARYSSFKKKSCIGDISV